MSFLGGESMRMQRNQDLRKQIREEGLFLYQVAEALEICESSLYRLLRRNLSDHERNRILQTITRLKNEY